MIEAPDPKLIDCSLIAKKILDRIRASKVTANIGAICVGKESTQQSYLKRLQNSAKELAGFSITPLDLPEDASLAQLQDTMEAWNADPNITGYLLLNPLPIHLRNCWEQIRKWLRDIKDFDVQGHAERGVFGSERQKGQRLPPTPHAVMKVIEETVPVEEGMKYPSQGKNVVVVGDGNVGADLMKMLQKDGATRTATNEHTKDLRSFLEKADIVIGASGAPDIIRGDMVKPGTVVINVGMAMVDGKWRGDVHVESVKDVAGKYSAISGKKSIGSVTTAMLFENALRSELLQKGSHFLLPNPTSRSSSPSPP